MDYEQSSAAEWEIPFTSESKSVLQSSQNQLTSESLSETKPVLQPSQHQLTSENLSYVNALNGGIHLAAVNGDPFTNIKVSPIPQSHPGHNKNPKDGNNSTSSVSPLPSAKSIHARKRKSPPDGIFKLSDTYGSYRERVLTEGKSFLKVEWSEGDLEVFKTISRKSNTFVQRPQYYERRIMIWGDPQSVQIAKDLLSSLFELCSAVTGTNAGKATQSYAHMQANSVNVQITSTSQQQKNDSLIYMLRRPPNVGPDGTPTHQMVFLWPDSEISIQQVLGVELEALDFLRLQYKCFIHLSEESEDVICVSGSEQETLQQAITHLETKWHELITSSTIKSKLYLLDLPIGDRTVRTISMTTIKGFAKPCFHLNSPNEGKKYFQGLWDRPLRSEDNFRLLSAVKRSLCCVPLIKGALTMRVSFGSFMFTNYRVPDDEKKGYPTEEFREMISHEMAKGQFFPGLEINLEMVMRRISDASHLFDLEETSTISLPGKSLNHMVSVEFDSINNEFLRLEVGFKAVGGRHERIKSRWIQSQVKGKFAENTPMMQAIMLGADKSDWKFEVKERKVLSALQKSQAMDEFDHQIRLRDGVMKESLFADPKRRVMLPDGFPVTRLIEKAAVQYRIKGTEYVLEIARFDIYPKLPNTGNSNMSFGPPSSSWGMTVYGVNWEDNLANLAGVKEVQQMGFNSVLDPFFSQKIDDANKAGFQGFVNVVKEVAWVLGHREEEVLERPPLDDQAQTSLL